MIRVDYSLLFFCFYRLWFSSGPVANRLMSLLEKKVKKHHRYDLVLTK